MRALVLSDLHVDKTRGDAPEVQPVDCDAVLFAGDLCDGAHLSMRWLADRLAGLPIYAVLGNHDVWRDGSAPGYTIEEQYDRCRDLGAMLGITVLERDVAYHGGDVRILGCTMWTDFECRPPTMSRKQAMFVSQNGYLPGDGNYRGERDRMNDFRFVHQIDPDGRRRRFTPARSIEIHKESVAWLEAQLATPHDGPTLEYLMTGDTAPEYFFHGHIHRSRDYMVGETRIIANPRGYPTRERGVMENLDWNPGLVIDIEPRPTPSMRI